MLTLLRNGFIQRMGLAVNPCVAPAAGVVSKPMLAPRADFNSNIIIFHHNRHIPRSNRVRIHLSSNSTCLIRSSTHLFCSSTHLTSNSTCLTSKSMYLPSDSTHLLSNSRCLSGKSINLSSKSSNLNLVRANHTRYSTSSTLVSNFLGGIRKSFYLRYRE